MEEIQSEVRTEPREEKIEEGLDYVSKSRIKTYKTCPRKFYLKYWCENRPPPTYATERGSEVHRIFEKFHENLWEFYERFRTLPDEWWAMVPDDATLEFASPFLGNFWKFERHRLQLAEDEEQFLPLSVEEYQELEEVPVGDIRWIGTADAVVHTTSLPELEGDGVVILDYKTGSVPAPEYRDGGIWLEQTFYEMLFEEKYDVDGVAAYYPREDELITCDHTDDFRDDVKEAALELQQPPSEDTFPVEEQPLCSYGTGACFFHKHGDSEGRPCPSDWGCATGPGPTYETPDNNRYD